MNVRKNGRHSSAAKKKVSAGRVFLYLKLFVCMIIICTAVVLKYVDAPIVHKITQKVNEELKIEEAIGVISNSGKLGEGLAEVFKIEENDEEKKVEAEPVFEADFYMDESDCEDLRREIEAQREKAYEEEKKLSVETLSFYMSEEELSDDSDPDIFRIPPPSYCSYEKADINFKYRTPLRGVITSRFGYRDHPIIRDASFHTGLDIAAKKGSTVVAFADGKVLEAGRNSTYGNYLLIEHANGIRSFYGHNSALSVKKGARVTIGQKIAEVGSTGMSTGPHLHFEVRKNNVRIDPALYISAEKV